MIQVSRSRLFATTLLAGVAFIATPAFAQVVDPATERPTPVDPSVPAAAQPEPVAPAPAPSENDAIVVTGSRIQSPNITSLSPVQVVGETEIDQSGAINVQEVLLENPVFGTPGLSRTNSAFLTSGAGVATVDLRDLGSDRTLILINNRRVVSGLSGSSTVDLNVIPTAVRRAHRHPDRRRVVALRFGRRRGRRQLPLQAQLLGRHRRRPVRPHGARRFGPLPAQPDRRRQLRRRPRQRHGPPRLHQREGPVVAPAQEHAPR